MAVEFRLLGDVSVVVDGDPLDLGHARQRCVLAVLLIEANQSVPVDRLAERVWGQRLPPSRYAALYSYLSRLRSVLAGAGAGQIRRRSGGYALAVDPATVDVLRFQRLVAEARSGTDEVALDLLDSALALWGATALAGLDTPWLNDVRDALHERRLAAELDRNDIALRRGQHARLLPELLTRSAAHPLDERLAGQVMLALHRSGRVNDALAHYQALRRRLAEELGSDPSAALIRLHEAVLRGDTEEPAAVRSQRRTAAQLPLDVPGFCGRTDELARLDRLLGVSGSRPTSVVIAALSGIGGVGKTALAVHWAHRVAHRFPDGQLFVNLRGYGGGPALPPGEAIHGFLEALGVPAQRIPTGLEAQVGQYRSALGRRRMLVLLDNARDAEQVRPLLPGAPGCLVVVTSRSQLTGLVTAEGAYPLRVEPLPDGQAHELLTARLGESRMTTYPDAAKEIIARCGGLALALAVIAARAATHPDFGLDTFAGALRDSGPGLDGWVSDDGGSDVRSVFSWSYRGLGGSAARMFRLLGCQPGHDITAAAAAQLAGVPVGEVRQLLAELARTSMASQYQPGRYAMHDLMRAYAAERTGTEDADEVREEAVDRLLDYYQYTAARADACLSRHTRTYRVPVPAGGPELSHSDSALAWLRAERANLLACLGYSRHRDDDARTVSLTAGLAFLLQSDGPWSQAIQTHIAAGAAAARLGDRLSEANASLDLGHVRYLVGDYVTATRDHDRALQLYRELDNPLGQANALSYLGSVRHLTGDYGEAVDALEQALAIYRVVGDRLGEAGALTTLGTVRYLTDDYPAAAVALTAARDTYRELGNRPGEASALLNLGSVRQLTGDYPEAAEVLNRALALYRGLDNRLGEANALTYLGHVLRVTGDHPAAAEAVTRAYAIFLDLGNRLGQATARTVLGDVRRWTGDHAAAERAFDEAMEIFRNIGDPFGEACARALLGDVCRRTGDHAAAERMLHEALAVFREIGDRLSEAEALNHLGALDRAAGRPEHGRRRHREALELAQAVHSPLEEAHSLDGAARCALELGDTATGTAELRAAREIYQRIGAAE